MNTFATNLHKSHFAVPWLRYLSYGLSVVAIIGLAASAISAQSSETTRSTSADNPGANTREVRGENVTSASLRLATDHAAATPALPAKKHDANTTSTREAECIHKAHQRLRPNADDGASYLATF